MVAEEEYTSVQCAHMYTHILLFHAESFLNKNIQKITSAIHYVNSQGVLST